MLRMNLSTESGPSYSTPIISHNSPLLANAARGELVSTTNLPGKFVGEKLKRRLTYTLTKFSLDKLFDWSGTDAAPENAREEILSSLNS